MNTPPAVMVHGLPMAREALRVAVVCGRPVTLLSAYGAAGYAGVGWWMALVAAARRGAPEAVVSDVLDCGELPGRALEALRAGQRALVLRAEAAVWADIAARAQDCGAVLLAEAPVSLDLGARGAGRRLPGWIAGL